MMDTCVITRGNVFRTKLSVFGHHTFKNPAWVWEYTTAQIDLILPLPNNPILFLDIPDLDMLDCLNGHSIISREIEQVRNRGRKGREKGKAKKKSWKIYYEE